MEDQGDAEQAERLAGVGAERFVEAGQLAVKPLVAVGRMCIVFDYDNNYLHHFYSRLTAQTETQTESHTLTRLCGAASADAPTKKAGASVHEVPLPAAA